MSDHLVGNETLLGHRGSLPDHSFPDGSILETPKLGARAPELAEVGGLGRRRWWERSTRKGFCQKFDRPRVRWQEDSPPYSCRYTHRASQDRAKSPETPNCSPQAGQPQDPAALKVLPSPSLFFFFALLNSSTATTANGKK